MTHKTQHIYGVYAVLLALVVFSYVLMYGPQPMFPTIAADFGVDKAAIGLLVTVFMIALCSAPLCVGFLVHRIGVRRAIVVASALIATSSAAYFVVTSYTQLVGLRLFQGFLMPIVLTSAMTCIAYIFRHLDLRRAMAGFVTASLVGSLSGRLLGGIGAETLGWRTTLACFGLCFVVVLVVVRAIPDPKLSHQKISLASYLDVFKVEGVPALLLIEACGIFSFAALGNVLPLRMTEIAAGSAEGTIGLMYLGYSIGLVASLAIAPLRTWFGSTKRLLLFGAVLYAVSLLSVVPASVTSLFLGLWFIAFGEFLVHSIAPGLINQLTSATCDRGIVNGLFLACYYLGGVAGSLLPGLLYERLGWSSVVCSMLFVQTFSIALVVWVGRHIQHLE